jgi:hypothetical protein
VSLSKDELLELMAYGDGEIDGSKLAEIEALVAKSDLAKRVLARQGALRPWAARTRDVTIRGSEGIAQAVMARMARIEELGGATVLRVPGERVRRGLHLPRAVRALGVVPRIATGFVAIAAVAASVGLAYFWLRGAPGHQAPVAAQDRKILGPSPTLPVPAAPPPARMTDTPLAVASAELPEESGIDIQAIESPEHQFSIFYVPGATGANAYASSVVVWIGEE